ncbi:hypothetical protein PSTG_10031 [Puccinia striiformis f. sp. tritici PST-78]|uniref:Uncharacterized protein n=1 Tax=Puccinia striiformis f. sp. tritici PST-78 TaxID=1165861 RepID=A0A0L0VCC8_9BASI|nr:hypothetical protein PSTG_10031 [Puccinia striiformis f. sp. tritici PST-78]
MVADLINKPATASQESCQAEPSCCCYMGQAWVNLPRTHSWNANQRTLVSVSHHDDQSDSIESAEQSGHPAGARLDSLCEMAQICLSATSEGDPQPATKGVPINCPMPSESTTGLSLLLIHLAAQPPGLNRVAAPNINSDAAIRASFAGSVGWWNLGL